jgi:glucosyl-dolichyl phosphate glucuronosyltransferase
MNDHNEQKFTLVIPTYNRCKLLNDLLESLEKVTVPENANFDVLIVDNNSTDNTQKMIEAFVEKKTLSLSCVIERQQGASFARNRGIREASGSIICFLDDDEIVDKKWLTVISDGFKRFQCDGISGRTFARWTVPKPDWYTTEGPFRIIGPTAGHNLGDRCIEYDSKTRMPTTANLAVKRDCFNKFGFFRTDMGPVQNREYFIGEDTEFCYRLITGGARFFYMPEAVVYNRVHEERVTKEFCRRYYFRIGRGMAMFRDPSRKARSILGIPFYLFREYFETQIAWVGAVLKKSEKAALFYRLELNRAAGKIYQLFINSVAKSR